MAGEMHFTAHGAFPLLPMRILLVKTSSLGDVVHNLPVVADLLRAYPGAQIDWVVEEGFVDIPRLHSGVRRIVPVALRRWRKSVLLPAAWREVLAFRAALRTDVYDLVIDTQGLLKSALIARMARGRRCGYTAASAREPLAARCYDARFDVSPALHAVERNRRLAAQAGGYSISPELDYGIADNHPPGDLRKTQSTPARIRRAERRATDSHLARRQVVARRTLDRCRTSAA